MMKFVLKMLKIKFHSQPICDRKYAKTKAKAFNNVVNGNLLHDKNSKRKHPLYLYCSNKHWFCHENE